MSSSRRLHRLTAFAAVSVLFAISPTVSALATQHDAAPAPSSVAVVTSPSAAPDAVLSHAAAARHAAAVPSTPRRAPVARPAAVTRTVHVTPKPTVRTTARATSRATVATAGAARASVAKPTARTAGTPTVAAASVARVGVRTISRYVDAPGSQKAIDSCKLVLWAHSPLWLAGHNWCGWQWMATVPTGATVRVTSGAAAGTYVVTGHLRLNRRSGPLPKVDADLVLQTCVGSGTGLTLLHRT